MHLAFYPDTLVNQGVHEAHSREALYSSILLSIPPL